MSALGVERGSTRDRGPARVESGYTLIELLIVTVILPIVVGAISLSLMAVFSLQSGVSNRLSDSGDAQIVSADFVKDVQSALTVTTNSAPQNLSPPQAAPCGSSNQVLGLTWGDGTEISYVEVAEGGGSSATNSLFRYVCQGGNTSTPVTTSVVSHDVSANQTACVTTVTVPNCTTPDAAGAGWIAGSTVIGVKFSITEPGSSYSYTLVAAPAASLPSSQQSTAATVPTTSCGFANPASGTYAANLCFVDFTPYGQSSSGCAVGQQEMSAAVVNTPYTMSFCISVSGGPVAPAATPTYFDPPTSEAFLGNNGFYTGIPGKPALYQTVEGSTSVVSITNIQVLDSHGNPATGWDLVSGDAESTDAGESITWTSNQTLSLLPNSPSSEIGNACAAPTTANPLAVDLTGVGTTTVECAATVSSDKTGTVMLEAQAPTTLTVTMVGSGLEAMFLGFLLPT
jgi:prepilin-type N-terminal cleavage/methylation domain-containing protein